MTPPRDLRDVPDVLLRITERRRQRLAEAGGADATGWAEGAPRTPADQRLWRAKTVSSPSASSISRASDRP